MTPTSYGATRSTAAYRRLAAAVGWWLGRADGVETVYVRRSVASGEASFPRSDVDLGIVVRDASPAVVGGLAGRVARLRRLLPALGVVQVHDEAGLVGWTRLDTYRGSIDRRADFSVHGPAPAIPSVPVEQRHALGRLAFWLETLVPRAIRRGDVANLRKFALEAVGAHAVVVGALAEPPLRRAESLRLPAARFLPTTGHLDSWLRAFFDVGDDAHAVARPQLGAVPAGSYELTLPGSGRRARLLVLESAGAELPAEARAPETVVVTAAALDLLVSCVNPALWWALPDELAACVRTPEPDALHHFARSQTALWRLCGPGFYAGPLRGPARRVALASDLAAGLTDRRDWRPPEPEPALVPSSRRDYYDRVFPRLRAEAAEIANRLEEPRVPAVA
jgi:hypothetical protein